MVGGGGTDWRQAGWAIGTNDYIRWVRLSEISDRKRHFGKKWVPISSVERAG